ncbi:cyclin-dependent kinase B1-1-like [Argentina anserina]|uniref:cyclin-dependent kinase B1-1-like n=1 Tax=Argentina anserina TaxID=57926 RepID=UPI0021764114|nr:cyclin-dependent kinase B1-1-like [Potentilla anserina]
MSIKQWVASSPLIDVVDADLQVTESEDRDFANKGSQQMEIFYGDMSLRQWIANSLPHNLSARPKMEDYEMSSEILRMESNCLVYKATHKETGELVAMRKVTADDGVAPPALVRELLVAAKFRKSAYVVNFRQALRVLEDNKVVYYVVYELLDTTDLHSFIAAKPLPSDVVKKVLFLLLQCVHECHSNGVRHRNLNPNNVLVDEKRGSLKIGADIGQSYSFFGEASASIPDGTVSLRYQAPEALLRSTRCRAAVDMWAVGCIFAEMVTGDVLFVGCGGDPKNTDKEQLREIFRQLGKPTEYEWRGVTALPGWEPYEEWEGKKMKARCYMAGDLPKDLLVGAVLLEQDGADLLSKMLTYDPAQRITTKAAMEHPYFGAMEVLELLLEMLLAPFSSQGVPSLTCTGMETLLALQRVL